MTRSRKQATDCFPGDPRFGLTYNPPQEHVEALGKREMLNVCLLDNLLQRAAMPPNDSNTDRQICHLGNFSALEYIENTNAYFIDLVHDRADPTPGETKRIRAKIQQTRYKFNKVFQMDKDIVNRLLIPIVDTSHFFVRVVDFNAACPEFYIKIAFYESLRRSTRGPRAVETGSRVAAIVYEINDFL